MPPSRDPLSRPSLHAPQADRSAVTQPAWEDMPALVDRNVALAQTGRRIFDCDLTARSTQARRELLAAAHAWTSRYRDVAPLEPLAAQRILLAGHQPQLYHPGVWLKNFALSQLAGQVAATAVNLIIDADTPKSTSLAVPGGTLDDPHLETISFDQPVPEIPFEERAVADPAMFASFGDRASEAMRRIVPDPLLSRFWPMVCRRLRVTNRLGVAIAQGRNLLESAWGIQTLEVPQSAVCDTASFAWFAVSILGDLERFRTVYNGVLADYRRAFHIRSSAQPMPDLAVTGEWFESPFWIWTVSNRRRRKLFVSRRGGGGLRLTDREGWNEEIPAPTDAAVEAWRQLRLRGVKIRSRALVTTLYARLVLGDVFLHGIGGANYDRAAEAIIERYCGLAPPESIVLSGTLHLPVVRTRPQFDVRSMDARLRELTWHPEHFAVNKNDGRITEKSGWIATPPSVENAKARFHAIRALNVSLQGEVAAERAETLRQRDEAVHGERVGRVLDRRDYAFCLFPERVIQEFLLGLLPKSAKTWFDNC